MEILAFIMFSFGVLMLVYGVKKSKDDGHLYVMGHKPHREEHKNTAHTSGFGTNIVSSSFGRR